MTPDINGKKYIGDCCYVQFDGYAIVLTTENGISVQNTVVLEPETFASLVAYALRLGFATPTEPTNG